MMNIHFGSLAHLIFFPFLALGIFGFMLQARRKVAIASLLMGANGSNLRYFSAAKTWLYAFLMMVGLSALFIALLSPQWTKKEEKVAQQGRDLLIALDVSRSMLAADVTPNRLQVAKDKIKQLLSCCSCERVGLILFSGAAFVQCPLTSDYAAFTMFLDYVDVETISSGATALDQAIKQALEVYRSTPDRKNKLLVIFTDGEDFSSNLTRYKLQAADNGMHIFAVGIGTPQGAPIPLIDVHGNQVGHQKDEQGSVVITKLNEPLLQSMAQEVGGTYIKMSSTDHNDMLALEKEVKRFEKEALDEQQVSHYENQYPYFVLIGFVCLAIAWIL